MEIKNDIDSEVINYIKTNDINAIKNMFSQYPDLMNDLFNKKALTLYSIIFDYHSIEILQTLIDLEVKMNSSDANHIFIHLRKLNDNNLDMLKLLINNGLDLGVFFNSIQATFGENLYRHACIQGYFDIFIYLTELGIEFSDGISYACETDIYGNFEENKYKIIQYWIDTNDDPINLNFVLARLSRSDIIMPKVINMLLQAGADVNYIHSYANSYYSRLNSLFDSFKLLTEKGVEPLTIMKILMK